ncbi:hypothetical protein WA538_003392 [Blastocystis sp. DL]
MKKEEKVLIQGYVLASGPSIGFKVGQKQYYVVLTNSLYYYETEQSYVSGCKPIGSIELNCFYISKDDTPNKFAFAIHAYPRSIQITVPNEELLNRWMDALHTLETQSNLPLVTNSVLFSVCSLIE